jgi:hypothetical protein
MRKELPRMNITGLTISEIGEKIKDFLPQFLRDDFYFQESYLLRFDEIKTSITNEFHKNFKDDDLINNISGSTDVDDFQ